MGRTVDPDVHSAFVEFRAKEDDKCLSVQCIYCQQIRAKNTSRQKQHLVDCPALRAQNAAHNQGPPPTNGVPTNGYGPPPPPGAGGPGGPGPGPGPAPATATLPSSNASVMPHGSAMQTPIQNMSARPSLPSQTGPPPPLPGSSSTPSQPQQPPQQQPPQNRAHSTPKSTPKSRQSTSNLPAPHLDDVHASFIEFRGKDEDKCLSVQCIYCQQVRAKNTSRQRQHLLECPTYLNFMKDTIPANNLQHTFPEGDIARSLQLPTPSLDLDFRMSIKLNPTMSVGNAVGNQRDWVTYIGGQWAGRWGKGIVLPGGQDSQIVVKELATSIKANYLLQTADDQPAYIAVKTSGWLTGPKEVLEKVADPATADSINPNNYKYRINVSMETGDERYASVNTGMWIGSGCRRGSELIFDAFRVS